MMMMKPRFFCPTDRRQYLGYIVLLRQTTMCPSLISSSSWKGRGWSLWLVFFQHADQSASYKLTSSNFEEQNWGQEGRCCRLTYRAGLGVFLFLSSLLHFFLLLLGSTYSIPEFPGEIISRILTSFILGLTHSSDTISCACTPSVDQQSCRMCA